MDLSHGKFFVAGTGKSGIASANLLVKIGSELILYNSDENTDFDEVSKQLESTDNVTFLSGEIDKDFFKNNHVDVLVASPGVLVEATVLHV